MKTYEAIDIISKAIIADGLCEAILVKGSIGRGDDDEFSDVDMYAVVKEEHLDTFLTHRMGYLESYLPLLYASHVNFVAEQIVAIFNNGLHFDLYTVTANTLPHSDKAKIIYDPANKFSSYEPEYRIIAVEELVYYFDEALYYFIEGDAAYRRGNYPWAQHIMSSTISCSAVLLRYLYDKDYAYLGLKKINEIIPAEQFEWLCGAASRMDRESIDKIMEYLIKLLDYIVDNYPAEISEKFNLKFYYWIKENIGITLFL
jgi:predicted nucleotidyltransferase